MQGSWKTTFTKATIWLLAEVVVNLAGLDNLADYSEFVFGKEFGDSSAVAVTWVSEMPLQRYSDQ